MKIFKFKDLTLIKVHDGLGAALDFDNNYGVSVVRHQFSYGHKKGLWEVAVLLNGRLCYDTDITQDVIGHLTKTEVSEIMHQVQMLDKKEVESMDKQRQIIDDDMDAYCDEVDDEHFEKGIVDEPDYEWLNDVARGR